MAPELLRLLADEQRDSDVRRSIADALGKLVKSEEDILAMTKLLDRQSIADEVYEALWDISQREGFRIFVSNGSGGQHVEVSKA